MSPETPWGSMWSTCFQKVVVGCRTDRGYFSRTSTSFSSLKNPATYFVCSITSEVQLARIWLQEQISTEKLARSHHGSSCLSLGCFILCELQSADLLAFFICPWHCIRFLVIAPKTETLWRDTRKQILDGYPWPSKLCCYLTYWTESKIRHDSFDVRTKRLHSESNSCKSHDSCDRILHCSVTQLRLRKKRKRRQGRKGRDPEREREFHPVWQKCTVTGFGLVWGWCLSLIWMCKFQVIQSGIAMYFNDPCSIMSTPYPWHSMAQFLFRFWTGKWAGNGCSSQSWYVWTWSRTPRC